MGTMTDIAEAELTTRVRAFGLVLVHGDEAATRLAIRIATQEFEAGASAAVASVDAVEFLRSWSHHPSHVAARAVA